MEDLNPRPLSLQSALEILPWRQAVPEALRTSHDISAVQQEAWWRSLSSQPHQYFEYGSGYLVAVGGLTYIDHVNGHAELSLLVAPKHRRKGIGGSVVSDLLDRARRMRLLAVVGEVYDCADGWAFWAGQVERYKGDHVNMPAPRKWWRGQAYGSRYFVLPIG